MTLVAGGFAHSSYSAYLREYQRADERTRTADPLIASEPIRVAGFARVCKPCIHKPVSFLRPAECCTVFRSRWYQSGIRTNDNYSLTRVFSYAPFLPHAGPAGARTMVWARSATRSCMKSLEMWFRTVFGLPGGLGPFTPFRTLD